MKKGTEPVGADRDRREALGRAIHEHYRRNQQDVKAPDDPAVRSWDELPEPLRESSRQRGDDIPSIVRQIGCGVRRAAGLKPVLFPFTADEVEVMAALVHEYWVAERRRAGWTAGPERDLGRKVTPYLAPYEELPEAVREWDRQVVRVIPEVLATVGLEVYRLRADSE